MPETLPTPSAAPLPNTPEARETDGTLRDQSEIPPAQTEIRPDAETHPSAAAPETYTAFEVPEGYSLAQPDLDKITPIFKELGLNQAQAQKLVSEFISRDQASRKAQAEAIDTMRQQWRQEQRSDPQIGHRLADVQLNVGRAFDKLGDPQFVTALKAELNRTAMGDNPVIIKAFDRFASLINEGSHVPGSGPSAEGQRNPSAPTRTDAAHSMYPNLA